MYKVVQWITALVVLGWQFGCGMDLSRQQGSMQTGGSSIMFGEFTGLSKQAIDQWLICGSASWPLCTPTMVDYSSRKKWFIWKAFSWMSRSLCLPDMNPIKHQITVDSFSNSMAQHLRAFLTTCKTDTMPRFCILLGLRVSYIIDTYPSICGMSVYIMTIS